MEIGLVLQTDPPASLLIERMVVGPMVTNPSTRTGEVSASLFATQPATLGRQFAVYAMHDAVEPTIDAYGTSVIPAMS